MSQQEAPEGSAFGVFPLGDDPIEESSEGTVEQPETSTQTDYYQAEEPSEEGERRYAGKYQTVEALESAYNEAQAWGTRASQEAAELRRQQEQLQAQMAEQAQVLEALAPSIIQRQVEENPEILEQLQQAQQMQALVDQQVAPYRQQVEQMQRQQAVSDAELDLARRVQTWRQRTGVEPGTQEDVALANAVKALDLNFADVETGHLALDLALEASRDPDLLQVLQVNPHWIEIEGGIEEARRQVQMRRGVPTTQGNGYSRSNMAYVETGGQAAPTSGAPGASRDEFDEAIAAWQSEKRSPLLQ